MRRIATVLVGALATWLLTGAVPVALVSVQAAVAMQAPAPSPTADPMDVRKRELEIRKLEQDTSKEGRFRPYVPVAAALVALVAAGLAFSQFVLQRRLERRIRVEENVEDALERLLDYPTEGKSFSASATAALESLKSWTAQSRDADRHSKRVTDAIVTLVTDDVDFLQQRHAGFDVICLRLWRPYVAYLREHPRLQDSLLYKYGRAIEAIRERREEYVTTIEWSLEGYVVSDYTEEGDFLLLERLVEGYRRHVELITGDERRRKAVKRFAEVTGNHALTAQIFGKE